MRRNSMVLHIQETKTTEREGKKKVPFRVQTSKAKRVGNTHKEGRLRIYLQESITQSAFLSFAASLSLISACSLVCNCKMVSTENPEGIEDTCLNLC